MRNVGKIKWFSVPKGYGFITSNDRNEDYYFHVSNIKGADLPGHGDQVSFLGAKGPKGLSASDIEIMFKAEPEYRDDRTNCPNCNKAIIPRVMYNGLGVIEKSFCPFCGKTVKKFDNGCFIATAVYGDYNCYEVRKLRLLRDDYMQPYILGRQLVNLYYNVSPSIAKWLQTKPKFSNLTRNILNWLVRVVYKKLQ